MPPRKPSTNNTNKGKSKMPYTHQRYYYRVKSGCLTCRKRKVKCDEARPSCGPCTRLKRACVYKAGSETADPTTTQHQPTTSPLAPTPQSQSSHIPRTPDTPHTHHSPLTPRYAGDSPGAVRNVGNVGSTTSVGRIDNVHHWESPAALTSHSHQNHSSSSSVITSTPRHVESGDASLALISRDIELTVTIDVLALRTESPHTITLFLEQVECPCVTPFDPCNWQLAKEHIVHLAQGKGQSHSQPCPAIAACVTAVSMLYKAHVYALPLSGAQSLYTTARRKVDDLANDHSTSFDLILVASFLLCLFEYLHAGDITPHLHEPSPLFVRRLETWAQDDDPSTKLKSALSIRIVAWLKILQASTTRGGANGLLSKRVFRLLPNNSQQGPIPDIEPVPGQDNSNYLSNHVYQLLSGPIFYFYCRLQALSREIAKLTLYHRSRTTSRDQQEVVDRMAALKEDLHALWASRSVTQCQPADELYAQVAPAIARRITSLIAICNAAYYAELVEMGRQLGDPLSRLPDSRDALHKIRETVEGVPLTQGVSPGFLRALFLYAIESTEPHQTQWAVDKIARIEPRIYRGEFFSTFAEELAKAQIEKERRVTSRYFCIWYFGVSPPFM